MKFNRIAYSMCFFILGNPAFAQLEKFEKVQLSDKYYAEAAFIADLNNDGHQDILAGSSWWQGPDFKTMHSYYEAGAYTGQYTRCWRIFAVDINGDGRKDPVVIKGPGNDAHWYENKADSGNWTAHKISGGNENEIPLMFDLDGDGVAELLSGAESQNGYYKAEADPTQAWKFNAVSKTGFVHQNQHGIGGGDINGDGRSDLLQKNGWWEQPVDMSNSGLWVHREHQFFADDLVEERTGGGDLFAYDVDGDGDNDVITPLQSHGRGIAWYENKDGKGEDFEEHIILPPHHNSAGDANTEGYGVSLLAIHALEMADINGDGLQDLVAGSRYYTHHKPIEEGAGPHETWWFELTRTNGVVKYVPHIVSDEISVGTGVHAKDVNNDGMPDIVVAEPKGVYLFINKY